METQPRLSFRRCFWIRASPASAWRSSRVAGFGLLALGIAGWPDRDATRVQSRALAGLLAYNVLALFYLLYLGVRGEWVGLLLGPAVALHAVMTLLLGRAWLARRTPATSATGPRTE